MKKTLKYLAILAFMLVALLALTGCFGDKLVATKTNEETDFGGDPLKFEERIEMTFKDDKVDNVKMTYEFESKEQAESMKAIFNMAKSFSQDELNFEVKQSGKKLIMELDAKSFAEIGGEEETANMTKEQVKEMLEEQGYTVK